MVELAIPNTVPLSVHLMFKSAASFDELGRTIMSEICAIGFKSGFWAGHGSLQLTLYAKILHRTSMIWSGIDIHEQVAPNCDKVQLTVVEITAPHFNWSTTTKENRLYNIPFSRLWCRHIRIHPIVIGSKNRLARFQRWILPVLW